MQRILEQLKAFYGSLEALQRWLLLAAVGLSFASLVAVGTWSASPRYSSLLSGRSFDEVATAAAALDQAGIQHRLSADGSGLEVPRSEVGRAWMAVAGSDVLPSLSDVADMPAFLTPGQQSWAFTRAREGAIARMINQVEGVAASQVTIVPRAEGSFFGEERSARASVLVRLEPGVTLKGGQVRGIVNLVAAAVDGLDRRDVTLVDQRGQPLWGGHDDSGLEGGGDLVQWRDKVEKRYVERVTRALTPVLGPGRYLAVSASVELDATSREVHSSRIDPDSQAVISEQNDESADSKATPSGVPGVDANLPERAASSSADAKQSSERTRLTANYAYTTVDEVTREPGGGVKRVSVAVQVDLARVKALAAAGGEEGRSAEEIEQAIRDAVRTAVGFDESRGDKVFVSFVPFAEPETVAAVGPPLAVRLAGQAPYAVGLVALLLFFLVVVRPIVGRVVSWPTPDQRQEQEEEAAREAAREPDPDADLADRLKELVDNFESVEADDLNRLVERESDAAAQVIRLWARDA